MSDAAGSAPAEPAPMLLCFDGSECAEQAIRTAGELCGGGPALVAHAWLRPSAVMFQGRRVEGSHPLAEAAEEFDASTRERAVERAAEGVRVAREAGFDAEPVLVEHHHGTWRPLVELAIGRQARAVVVGSHGLSPVKSALLGSVSRGIANHCPRPVIVVPSTEAREQ